MAERSGLPLVSPSWNPHFHDPLLFNAGSELRTTEHLACINIHSPTDQSEWYLLIRGNHPSHFLSLPKIPIQTLDSACATLDHSLYVLGGSSHGSPSDTVQVYDARHHIWTTAPRMCAPRQFATAGAIGGRMYVVGSHLPSDDSWAEAFNPISGKWSPVPRSSGLPGKMLFRSGTGDGCFRATDNGGVLYEPYRTVPMPRGTMTKNFMGQMVVLDGLVYTCNYGGNLAGYDPATNNLIRVEGVDLRRELQPDLLQCSRMTNLGGLVCLVCKDSQTIHCIAIQVTRTSNQRLLGSITWRESVPLPTDTASSGELIHCVSLVV